MERGQAETVKVGYRRPPAATRFKPGRSGNPRGRIKTRKRRGEPSLAAIIEAAFAETVRVEKKGRPQRMSKLRVTVEQLVNRAAGGDHRIAQLLFALAGGRESPQPPPPPERLSEGDRLVMEEFLRRFGEMKT